MQYLVKFVLHLSDVVISLMFKFTSRLGLIFYGPGHRLYYHALIHDHVNVIKFPHGTWAHSGVLLKALSGSRFGW